MFEDFDILKGYPSIDTCNLVRLGQLDFVGLRTKLKEKYLVTSIVNKANARIRETFKNYLPGDTVIPQFWVKGSKLCVWALDSYGEYHYFDSLPIYIQKRILSIVSTLCTQEQQKELV